MAVAFVESPLFFKKKKEKKIRGQWMNYIEKEESSMQKNKTCRNI